MLCFAATQVHPMERVLNEQRQREEEAKSAAAVGSGSARDDIAECRGQGKSRGAFIDSICVWFSSAVCTEKERKKGKTCLTLDEDSLECAAAAVANT